MIKNIVSSSIGLECVLLNIGSIHSGSTANTTIFSILGSIVFGVIGIYALFIKDDG